uniref:Myelin P2 protein n=1 Tax=Caligus rogercresseyi TaxID=217165 RepID=C1BMM3_CALRO|nr:Myelin P2 protein [Caligus rogercresseyi]
MAEEFFGSWNWVSNTDSFDDYLKEIGINIVLRKLSKLASPTLTFSKKEGDDETWIMRTETVVKSISVDFKLDEEFKETTIDGRLVHSTFTLVREGTSSSLILRQKSVDKDGKISIIDRSIDGDIMKVGMNVNHVKASAIFKRK